MEDKPQHAGASPRWDDPSIATEMFDVPEPARQSYREIKVLVRDHYGRDLTLFAAAALRLGVPVARITWSQVLRGRGWVDFHHRPREVISVESFLNAARVVLQDAYAQEMSGRRPFIWTSVAEDIRDYVSERNKRSSPNRWGRVIGETGTGKTETAKALRREWRHRFFWVEAPENASRAELIDCMGRRYGFGTKTKATKTKEQLFRVVARDHIWWIDNAQRLYVPGDDRQMAMDFLLRLQEHTGFTPILCFTPIEEQKVRMACSGWWEQIEGRSGGVDSILRLPEYPPADDAVLIALAYGLADAPSHRSELHSICLRPGRIRILFEVLSMADDLASAEGRVITIEDIRSVAPKSPVDVRPTRRGK